MGPGNAGGKTLPGTQDQDAVEITFAFEEWYCGWDAMELREYQGIRFSGNTLFAWCGPVLGLTPSNHREDVDTLLELPRSASRLVIYGHSANGHYNFRGADEPIEALDANGHVVASGKLTPWFKRARRALILEGTNIKYLRVPTSKPVFFLRRLKIYFENADAGESPSFVDRT